MKKSLTPKEAVDYIAHKYKEYFHYNTVVTWLRNKKIIGWKIGGQWRLTKSSIDNFFCKKN